MLDIRRIRVKTEEVKEAMKIRGESVDLSMIDRVVELDEERRKLLTEVELLKNKKNGAVLTAPLFFYQEPPSIFIPLAI